MDYFRFHFATAKNAAYRPTQGKNLGFSVNTAIVFSVMALDAWISERAFRGVRDGELSKAEYDKWMRLPLERRWGRVLMRLHRQRINLQPRPGRDLPHLVVLRNALVHYNPFMPFAKGEELRATPKEMVDKGLWGPGGGLGWDDVEWPLFARPEVGGWAVKTVCRAAMEIREASTNERDRTDLELTFKV